MYCGSCGADEILFGRTLISRFGCMMVNLMLYGAISYASDCKRNLVVNTSKQGHRTTSHKPSRAHPAAQ